jgi:hypothetical protein
VATAAAAVVATVVAVVDSTEEVSAVAVSMVVGFMEEVSAVAVSVGDVSAVVVSMAAAFVGDVSAIVVSTAVAFAVAVLVGATSAITDSLMMSSSVASAFRGGGAGTIRTDITVTAITRTAMDTPVTHMAMDTAGIHMVMDTAGTVTTVAPVMDIAMGAARVTDTAMVADQGIRGVRGVGDKPGTAI